MNYFIGYTQSYALNERAVPENAYWTVLRRAGVVPEQGDTVFLAENGSARDSCWLIKAFSVGELDPSPEGFVVLPDNIRPLRLGLDEQLVEKLPPRIEGTEGAILVPLSPSTGKELLRLTKEALKSKKSALSTTRSRSAEPSVKTDEDRVIETIEKATGRLGQGSFRDRLLTAYGNKCAVTLCGVVECLAAAHILEYSKTRNHDPSNGILLRADIHALFDQHLLRIYPGDPPIIVLTEVLLKAPGYKDYHHKGLLVPENPFDRPDNEKLLRQWNAANEVEEEKLEPPPPLNET